MLKITQNFMWLHRGSLAGSLLMLIVALAAADCEAQRLTDSEKKVRDAYRSGQSANELRLNEFRTIYDWLTESAGKEKWREINWRFNLLKARDEAARTNKPIFIWAMNGDPLGCV